MSFRFLGNNNEGQRLSFAAKSAPRVRRSSLSCIKMLATRFLAVYSARKMRSAIWRSVAPSAISSRV